MVEVNPQVPKTQERDYIGFSKPIEQPRFISGKAATLEGAGNLLEGVTKGATELIKSAVNTFERPKIEAFQDAENQRLQDIKGATEQVASAQTPGGDSLVAGAEKPLPSDLRTLPQQIDTLDRARSIKGGKLPESDFRARYDALMKDIRSRYPTGFTDYINSVGEKVTGIPHSASAYMSALVHEINQNLSDVKSHREKVVTKLRDHYGDPNMPNIPEYIRGIENGTTSIYQADKYLNQGLARKGALANDTLELAHENLSNETKAKRATAIADNKIGQLVTDRMAAHFKTVGLPEDPVLAHDYLMSGKMSPETARVFAQSMAAKEQVTANEARASLYVPLQDASGNTILDPKTGKPATLIGYMGSKAANDLVDNHMKVFKDFSNYATNEKWGPAQFMHLMSEAMRDTNTVRLLKNPSLGPPLLDMSSIEKLVGSQAAATLFPALIGLFNTREGAYIAAEYKGALESSPDPVTGQQRSVKDTVEWARQHGYVGKDNAPMYNSLFKMIERVSDPLTSPEEKKKAVEYTFNPRNYGLLSQIEQDGIDPHTGRRTSGQFSIYDRFTKQDFVNGVRTLGGNHWNMYKDWVQTTFNSEILKPKMMELNDLKLEPGMSLSWHEADHRWGLDMGQYKDINISNTKLPIQVRAVAARLGQPVNDANRGILALSRIAEAEGRDAKEVDAYVVRTMIELGLDPTVGKIQGMSEDMINAIKASRQQEEQNTETTRAPYRKKK